MSYLIYINELGPNYKGENLYEFIFSNSLENVWGEQWDSKPANGYPLPPNLEYIEKIGYMKNNSIKFEVLQNSDYFSMIDAQDDVISLGWEMENEQVNFDMVKRLVFRYGDTEKSVKDKFYERDIILEFEKKVEYEN
jgi:hypothetical protein